jgi:hypothetical protein
MRPSGSVGDGDIEISVSSVGGRLTRPYVWSDSTDRSPRHLCWHALHANFGISDQTRHPPRLTSPALSWFSSSSVNAGNPNWIRATLLEPHIGHGRSRPTRVGALVVDPSIAMMIGLHLPHGK